MACYTSWAKIVVLDKATKKDQRSIPIRSNPITFGTHPMNTIQIRSEWAERLHCKIAVEARSHTATIVNFSKACPVLVNGEQQAAKAVLENNHHFEVAGVLFRWCFDAAENSRNKIRVPCPSRIPSRPLKRVKSSENFTINSKSYYAVPQSLNSFLGKIRSRRTLASITRTNLAELLTDVELDANSTTTPTKAVIPDYLITPVKERENAPLPTPDRPNRTPGRKQQLNRSGLLVVSYTPTTNHKEQRHAHCKTPLSTTKRTPLRLKNGVAVTPAPATPDKFVNVSKPDHSMYLIDLTTPKLKSGLACKTPKKPATPLMLPCINLVTPSPKNSKATPMQSKKAPLSETRGLLKSAIKNSSSICKSSASKRAITPARKPMLPLTPISRRGTPMSAKSTPITTKHRVLLREMEPHSTPARAQGEKVKDVERSDEVQPVPVVAPPLNDDTETHVALDTIPMVMQPAVPFNVCALIKKPNQTRQVRSAKYSDVTPHESFVEGQEAKSLEEALQRDNIQVADLAQQIIVHDSPANGKTQQFTEEELLASDTEALAETALPLETEDELLLLDSDTELSSKQSKAAPTTTTTAPVAALSSPRLRNSLRDTRKFISSAYTSLNTSRPQMDLTAEIDESLLLEEDTLDDEEEPANRTYDLTDLSDRPSAPEEENGKRLSKSFTISVDAARSPGLHRSPVQFMSTRKVDKTLCTGMETLTSRSNESASHVEGGTAARPSYAAGESENCTESSLYVWNSGTVDGPPASEHLSVANDEEETVVVDVVQVEAHDEFSAGTEINDLQESPEKLAAVDDETEDCCGGSVHIQSGPKEVETIPDFRGMKQMLKTPKATPADVNLVGLKEMLNTPPVNELTVRNFVGVKCLFNSSPAKQQRQGVEDLRGIRELLKTPKTTTKEEEAMPNLVGMKEMLRTPTTKGTPDASSLAGVRNLWRTPKVGVAATRPSGMRKICTSSPATPSLAGVRELMKTPQTRVEVDDDVAAATEFPRTPVRRTKLDVEVPEETQALPTTPSRESMPDGVSEKNSLCTAKSPQQLETEAVMIIDEDAEEDINTVLAGGDVGNPGEADLSTNGCSTPTFSRLDAGRADEQKLEGSFLQDDELMARSVCDYSVVGQDSSLADTVAPCIIEEGKALEQEFSQALSSESIIPKDEPAAVGNQVGREESAVSEHSTAAAIVDAEEEEEESEEKADSVRSKDVADVPLNDTVGCTKELIVVEKNEGKDQPETMLEKSVTDDSSNAVVSLDDGEEHSTPPRMVEQVVPVPEEGLSSTCTISPDLVVKEIENLVPPEVSSCESQTDGQAIDEKASSDHDDVSAASPAACGATIVLVEEDKDDGMPQSQSDDCEVISSSPEKLIEELNAETTKEPPVTDAEKNIDTYGEDLSPVSKREEQELSTTNTENPSGQTVTERNNPEDMPAESPQGSISTEEEIQLSQEQVLPESPLDESIMSDRQAASDNEEIFLEQPSVEAAISVQDAEKETSVIDQSLTTTVCDVPAAEEKPLKTDIDATCLVAEKTDGERDSPEKVSGEFKPESDSVDQLPPASPLCDASICEEVLSKACTTTAAGLDKKVEESQESTKFQPDATIPDPTLISSPSRAKEQIEESSIEASMSVQDVGKETNANGTHEFSVSGCDVSVSENLESLLLEVEKTEEQELPDSPLDESMLDRTAISSSPLKELIEKKSAVKVATSLQEVENETSGNGGEISETICDAISASESIEIPSSLAVEKTEEKGLVENPSGEPVPESIGLDDVVSPVSPSSNVSIGEAMKNCQDSEAQVDRELISNSPSFTEEAAMSVQDVEKETRSESVRVVPVFEEKIISTETTEASCPDETTEEQQKHCSLDDKSIAEPISEAAITGPDAEKVNCLTDESESKPLTTETEEDPCVVVEGDEEQDLSKSASGESKPDCEAPPTPEDMPKKAMSMDAVAEADKLRETPASQGTVEKVDKGATTEEQGEFKTPKTAAPKRRLYSKRIHEAETPEMKTPSPVTKLTDQDYLKILDDLNEKQSKQSKSSSQQSPLERRVLPSRAARNKIQTLCVEDLAGASPEEEFPRSTVPAANGLRRVIFNSAVAVREFDSPNISGDIIMNKKLKGRWSGRKKLVVEEATLAVADAASGAATMVTADGNDTTSEELVQGHEEAGAKRRGRSKRQQEPEVAPTKRTARGKANIDSTTDSETPVKATKRRGRKAAAVVQEEPVTDALDAIASTEATTDKPNQEEEPEESAGAKRPRKAAALKRKIYLPEQSVEESKETTDQAQERTLEDAHNESVSDTPVKATKRGRKATGKENGVSSAPTEGSTKDTQPEEEPAKRKPRGRQRKVAAEERKIAPVADESVEVALMEKGIDQEVQEDGNLEPPSDTPVKTTKRGVRKVTRKENLPSADASNEVVLATAAATEESTQDQIEEDPAKSGAKRPRKAAATKRKIAPVADESVEVTLTELKEGSVEEKEQEGVPISSAKQPRKVAGKTSDFESVNASSTPAKPARGKRIARKKGIALDESIDPIMMEKETTLDRHVDKSLESESEAGDRDVEPATAAATAASTATKAKGARGKKPAPLEASVSSPAVPARATRMTRGRKQLEASDANTTDAENTTTDLPQSKRRGRPAGSKNKNKS